MSNKTLSKYKYRKIASESLRNALRLHKDSILLYANDSFPSSFQLSVLSLEEFAKAKWVDRVFDIISTNDGFPKEGTAEYEGHVQFEQKWLKLLYKHPEKQLAFIGQEIFDYKPDFVTKVRERKLEFQKQQAVYVGLDRSKGKIDTESRISIPTKKIKQKQAKEMIALVNHEFVEIYNLIQKNGCYWSDWDMDEIIGEDQYGVIFRWPHKTDIKSKKWMKKNFAKIS
jgi:AbiV family abortive infection protein